MYEYNEAFGVLIKQKKRRGFHTYLFKCLAWRKIVYYDNLHSFLVFTSYFSYFFFFCEIAILENCILFFYEFPILSSFFPLRSFLKNFFFCFFSQQCMYSTLLLLFTLSFHLSLCITLLMMVILWITSHTDDFFFLSYSSFFFVIILLRMEKEMEKCCWGWFQLKFKMTICCLFHDV